LSSLASTLFPYTTLFRSSDDNSTTLKGIIAARLTLLDDAYAKMAGSKFKDLANVEPDMKRSVVMGYARSSNDHDGLMGRFDVWRSEEHTSELQSRFDLVC